MLGREAELRIHFDTQFKKFLSAAQQQATQQQQQKQQFAMWKFCRRNKDFWVFIAQYYVTQTFPDLRSSYIRKIQCKSELSVCVCAHTHTHIYIYIWSRRSGNRIPVGARFSAPAQTGPGAYSAFCTMGVRPFTGVKRPERGVEHQPRLAPSLKREPLVLIWGFFVCCRANFILLYLYYMVHHLCMCKAFQFRSISNTRERYRPEPDYPATCVVARQYSPTTTASLSFHSHKEKFGVLLKNVGVSAFLGFRKTA